MQLVIDIQQVFGGIQEARTGAPAFCTNFFPVPAKLENWIRHQELFAESRPGAWCFFRKRDGFWHLYFSAASPEALQKMVTDLPALSAERVAADVVGREDSLAPLTSVLQTAGFRPYQKLIRLARAAATPAEAQPGATDAPVEWAVAGDTQAILQLLGAAFDRYADQLPTDYEIEAAIQARQILVVREGGELGALLFFEAQGFTSSVRYWAVAEAFRSRRLGAALMRRYFAEQPQIRRFNLWVNAENDNAIGKYRHYGYTPDGLSDAILVNSQISS